jgi:hypothetical protein
MAAAKVESKIVAAKKQNPQVYFDMKLGGNPVRYAWR